MRIVDVHTHFFSRPFFDTLAALAGRDDLDAIARAAGFDLPPDDLEAHLARWLADLDRHDVEHMVTFASVPEEATAVAEAVRRAPDRLTGCALFDPRASGAEHALRSLLDEQGFAGVLLFPAMHHYRVGAEPMRALLPRLSGTRSLVFVHCGMLVVRLRDRLGLPRPYDLAWANPLDVVPAANAAPGAHFVIPHFGAGFFRETLMAGAQCENVYVDTSSSNAWMRTQPDGPSLRDVVARCLDVFGPDRILFGTDSNVFPAGWRADRLEELAACLDLLGVRDADREKILGGNARRLLSARA